ncbi:hypothetical protein [Blastopirellula marina]|uniref:Signal transduction histidine kinase dimerisation/phosphoacceptor domain-containing protein n=1 Tax=Blastopirellula marina DSM 3645 TaxID=314230 RepID=A3ZU83_9BACT|nr:hypothetical protein [Blastopirellula marina]EAQ79785.1 hypothetical protein DSM3645_21634 [Blastopirellula marina DSM 3645]
MTADNGATSADAAARKEQLRQLGHDIKSYLGVVTMGFQALDGAKGDPEEFAELFGIIQEDGIKPLKQTVLDMVKLACEEE